MREAFERRRPGVFFLDADDPDALGLYLAERGWIPADEAILRSVERAGEGNMNLVLRARTPRRSLVVKQARPWVEKYPDIEAPLDRARVEAAFYRTVASTPAVATGMPELLGADDEAAILAIEDLGEASDYTGLYAGAALADSEIEALTAWLSALHGMAPPDDPVFDNRGMRTLNHTHVFALPLQPDALDRDAFTPGLQDVAEGLCADQAYTARVAALGERYLRSGGRHLLHGDFFPGSWLRTPDGPRIIDPEFAFVGPAEFDLGVALAHLVFAGWHPETAEATMRRTYAAPPGFDHALTRGFAGVELVRRLLGVAQLPLRADLEAKRRWLDLSRRWVLE